jgi:hypothetical protein
MPENEIRMADLHPQITTSASGMDTHLLVDGDLGTSIALPIAAGAKSAWIQFEFEKAFPAQAFFIATPDGGFLNQTMPDGEMQASQDGTSWVTLVNLPNRVLGDFSARTYSFPETAARFFRVVLTPSSAWLKGDPQIIL